MEEEMEQEEVVEVKEEEAEEIKEEVELTRSGILQLNSNNFVSDRVARRQDGEGSSGGLQEEGEAQGARQGGGGDQGSRREGHRTAQGPLKVTTRLLPPRGSK